jgi:hypothetical protein
MPRKPAPVGTTAAVAQLLPVLETTQLSVTRLTLGCIARQKCYIAELISKTRINSLFSLPVFQKIKRSFQNFYLIK